MAFRLKRHESVHKAMRRIIHKEIEATLDVLAQAQRKPAEAVHDVRTHCKKIRAALRLVRNGIGDTAYRHENHFFRDTVRPLTKIRDAKVYLKTLDKLTKNKLPILRESLQDKYQGILKHKAPHSFTVISDHMKEAVHQLGDWKLPHTGRKQIYKGLRHTYRQGRRAFFTAKKDPTDANLHECRKQSKYLWYQLQILEAVGSGKIKTVKRQCHRLEKCLGDDHDLAMLRQHIPDNLKTVKQMLPKISKRRASLQAKALKLGKSIYKDKPKQFADRCSL